MNNSLCCATFTMYQFSHLLIIISGVNINTTQGFRCWNDAFRFSEQPAWQYHRPQPIPPGYSFVDEQ